jgi:hypothetical protein
MSQGDDFFLKLVWKKKEELIIAETDGTKVMGKEEKDNGLN